MANTTIYSLIILIIGVIAIIKIYIHLKYFSIKYKDDFNLNNLSTGFSPLKISGWLAIFFMIRAMFPIPIFSSNLDDEELAKKKKTINILVYCLYLFIVLAIILEKVN